MIRDDQTGESAHRRQPNRRCRTDRRSRM